MITLVSPRNSPCSIFLPFCEDSLLLVGRSTFPVPLLQNPSWGIDFCLLYSSLQTPTSNWSTVFQSLEHSWRDCRPWSLHWPPPSRRGRGRRRQGPQPPAMNWSVPTARLCCWERPHLADTHQPQHCRVQTWLFACILTTLSSLFSCPDSSIKPITHWTVDTGQQFFQCFFSPL